MLGRGRAAARPRRLAPDGRHRPGGVGAGHHRRAADRLVPRRPRRRRRKPIDTLWDVLIIFSVPVFVGVTVVVMFSAVKFRVRPGEDGLDGPPIHGNTRLEVIWTAIPAIVLVGLCTYAFVVLEDVEAVEGRPAEVRVVGEQFTWTFFYERGGEEVASTQLYLEVDKQVRFTLQAKDVLHDFSVPAFRMKKDAVPGIDVEVHRDAEQDRQVRHRVRRALRARPLRDALDRRTCSRSRPTTRRSRTSASPRRALRAATPGERQGDLHVDLRQLPHAGRRGHRRRRSAPTSTRRWPTRTRRSSANRSWTPDKVIADGYAGRRDAGQLRRHAGGGAGRRAREVPFRSDQGGLMTARLRAPGIPRAFLFLRLRDAVLRGDHHRRAGGLRLPGLRGRQDRHEGAERDPAAVDADRAAVLPGRARRVRLLVPLGGGQADDPRGPLGPRRDARGGTTSGSTPITR